jgi:hypothetical protein
MDDADDDDFVRLDEDGDGIGKAWDPRPPQAEPAARDGRERCRQQLDALSHGVNRFDKT